ncbi:hypothetical protein BDV97DRAFT_370404 [Delphinella strobiligena]|nr:hypothetical protein BDV97DRAFT_370404 [Delphinella strobiligena]
MPAELDCLYLNGSPVPQSDAYVALLLRKSQKIPEPDEFRGGRKSLESRMQQVDVKLAGNEDWYSTEQDKLCYVVSLLKDHPHLPPLCPYQAYLSECIFLGFKTIITQGLAKAIESGPKPSQDASTHAISSLNLAPDFDKEKVAIAAISLQQKMTEIETTVVEVSKDPIGMAEASLFSSIRVDSGIERSQSDLATFTLDLCHPPRSGLLATDKAPNSYPTCKDALEYLKGLPVSKLALIKRVLLPDGLMSADDMNNKYYWGSLCRFLTRKMILDVVTLAVPDDLNQTGRDHGQYEWFGWELHAGILGAFKVGLIHEIRFAYPKQYIEKGPNSMNILEYHNVGLHIEHTLFPKLSKAFWDIYNEDPDFGDDWKKHWDHQADMKMKRREDMWSDSGLKLEFLEAAPHHHYSQGTTLVLRRKSLSDFDVDSDYEL